MIDAKKIELEIVCGGQSMMLSRGQNYNITLLNGLESSDVTINMQSDAQSDGGRETGVRIEPRCVEIETVYTGLLDKEVVRSKWLHHLNPHSDCTLRVNYCGVKRHVGCKVSVPFRDLRKNLAEPLRFAFTLQCPKPALLGEGFRENMAGKIPVLCAPFSVIRGVECTVSYKIFRDKITVNNTGDMPVGLTLTFTAKGPVKNPRLDNLTSGEYIRIECSMVQGDVLLISTTQGRKRVEMNGVNISNQKDRRSKFLQLRCGENILQYSADENYTNLDDVRPSCDFAYLGV